MTVFKNFFGGMQQNKPPDRKTVAKWLCGNWDARQVHNLLLGSNAAFLEQMDAERIVERHASASDLNGDGSEFIKGKILKMMSGPAPGYVEKPLTPSQAAVAEKVYNEIRLNRYGELYTSAMATAILNASMAWYAEKYEHSIAIATHVIDDIAPDAGEAYRIRAFAFISLGRFEEAVADLRRALASIPQPTGAAEPLAAIEAFLQQQRQAPH
jgi:tetratricopeptide (TPR) repeat protein